MNLRKFVALGSALVLALASLLSLSLGGVADASGGTPLYWCERSSNGDFNNAAHWSTNSSCSGGNQLPANGDDLVFDNSPLTSALQVTDDMSSNLEDIGLTFQGDSCDGYILTASGGNSIGLEYGITDTVTPTDLSSCSTNQPQTTIASALPLSLENSQTITANGGNDTLDINGLVALGTNDLTVSGNSNGTISLASLTGSGSLTISGPGSGTYGYILTTSNSSYSGPVTIDNNAAVSDQSSDLDGLGAGTITIQSGGALTYYSQPTSGKATVSNAFNLGGSGDSVNLGAITLCLTTSCTSGDSTLNLTGDISLTSNTELGNGAYSGGGSSHTPSENATYNFTGKISYSGFTLTAYADSNTTINVPATSGSSSSKTGPTPGSPNSGSTLSSNQSFLALIGGGLIVSAISSISFIVKRSGSK